MNPLQHRKYCICAAQAVAALRKLGHQGTDAELRSFCRVQALGRDKDSHRLNNLEFDRVLAVFSGYHSMGDLAEQLRLLDQPLKRLLVAATPMLDALGIADHGREAYLGSIYQRVQAKRETSIPLSDIPDRDVALVLGALNHTVEHRSGAHHNHPRTGRGPRSRTAHRVGYNAPPPVQLELQVPASRTPARAAESIPY